VTLGEVCDDAGAVRQSTVGRDSYSANASDDFPLLLIAAKRGDEEAFAIIWRRFQPPLLRYMRVISGGAAEDLSADAWLQVTRKLVEFEGDETAFRAWLYTIARNRHIDWCRQSARRSESPVEIETLDRHPGTEDPVATVEAKMSTDSALALVATLPADQAEAVMLRAVAGLPVAVAAEIMGRPPGTVRVLCHRGLRRLEQTLKGGIPPATRAVSKFSDAQDVVV
jgi:RNA polymerase sigma-70 factor (ECF subfamily)